MDANLRISSLGHHIAVVLCSSKVFKQSTFHHPSSNNSMLVHMVQGIFLASGIVLLSTTVCLKTAMQLILVVASVWNLTQYHLSHHVPTIPHLEQYMDVYSRTVMLRVVLQVGCIFTVHTHWGGFGVVFLIHALQQQMEEEFIWLI
jgi:hypothetical protein